MFTWRLAKIHECFQGSDKYQSRKLHMKILLQSSFVNIFIKIVTRTCAWQIQQTWCMYAFIMHYHYTVTFGEMGCVLFIFIMLQYIFKSKMPELTMHLQHLLVLLRFKVRELDSRGFDTMVVSQMVGRYPHLCYLYLCWNLVKKFNKPIWHFMDNFVSITSIQVCCGNIYTFFPSKKDIRIFLLLNWIING